MQAQLGDVSLTSELLPGLDQTSLRTVQCLAGGIEGVKSHSRGLINSHRGDRLQRDGLEKRRSQPWCSSCSQHDEGTEAGVRQGDKGQTCL